MTYENLLEQLHANVKKYGLWEKVIASPDDPDAKLVVAHIMTFEPCPHCKSIHIDLAEEKN